MQLTIITPTKKEMYTVTWVEINTPSGNFVIQPGHVPMAMSLSSNKPLIYALTTGKEVSMIIDQAIVDISRTGIVVLMNTLS